MTLLVLVFVTLYSVVLSQRFETYHFVKPNYFLDRVFQDLKEKRKPSIGLSLAEYVADPARADNFHFLHSRRRRSDEPRY